MFTIRYAEGVLKDLNTITAFYRSRILNAIEEQLAHQPQVETRNRKMLEGLHPPWEDVRPVWELRVGDYRVFYDVEEDSRTVVIRAMRYKPPHKTTEEIL